MSNQFESLRFAGPQRTYTSNLKGTATERKLIGGINSKSHIRAESTKQIISQRYGRDAGSFSNVQKALFTRTADLLTVLTC